MDAWLSPPHDPAVTPFTRSQSPILEVLRALRMSGKYLMYGVRGCVSAMKARLPRESNLWPAWPRWSKGLMPDEHFTIRGALRVSPRGSLLLLFRHRAIHPFLVLGAIPERSPTRLSETTGWCFSGRW